MTSNNPRGIPNIQVSMGDVDANPFAPLHRRLGIRTYVHRQAVTDYHGGFDKDNGQYFSPHEYRAPVTLAKIFA